jgi:hypothetical protein
MRSPLNRTLTVAEQRPRKRGRPSKNTDHAKRQSESPVHQDLASPDEADSASDPVQSVQTRKKAKRPIPVSSDEGGFEPRARESSDSSGSEDEEVLISANKPSKLGHRSITRKLATKASASSLTKSQQLALDYPRFAVIPTDFKRKSRVTDDAPDLTTHYVSRQVRPNIKFTAEWTKEDEDRLWDRWTVNDELLLRATTDAECALWRKGQIVYGLALPDILPDDVHFDTSGNKPVIVPGTSGKMLENTNLSLDYTSILSTIFSCKPFMKDIEIFRYFVRYVLHMRLPKVYTMPSSAHISSHNASIVEEFKKQSELLGMPIQREQETILRTILNKEYSQQKFKYKDFLVDLKTQCQNSFSSKKPGLMRKDIHNIVKAWDETYVQSSTRKHLKTMAEYQKEYNNSGKIIKGPGSSASLSSGNDKVLRDKRDWIMASRRQDAINSKVSTDSAPSTHPRSIVQETSSDQRKSRVLSSVKQQSKSRLPSYPAPSPDLDDARAAVDVGAAETRDSGADNYSAVDDHIINNSPAGDDDHIINNSTSEEDDLGKNYSTKEIDVESRVSTARSHSSSVSLQQIRIVDCSIRDNEWKKHEPNKSFKLLLCKGATSKYSIPRQLADPVKYDQAYGRVENLAFEEGDFWDKGTKLEPMAKRFDPSSNCFWSQALDRQVG